MKTLYCGYSLEVPHWGTSDEYPQHVFLWRNKKNNFLDSLHIWNYGYCCFYTPPHDSGGVLWFHIGRVSIRPSICHTSIFLFRMITSVNVNGFSRNLVCALILWRSGLGLLMGKFLQFFTELSARDTTMAGYYSLTFLFYSCYFQYKIFDKRISYLLVLICFMHLLYTYIFLLMHLLFGLCQ